MGKIRFFPERRRNGDAADRFAPRRGEGRCRFVFSRRARQDVRPVQWATRPFRCADVGALLAERQNAGRALRVAPLAEVAGAAPEGEDVAEDILGHLEEEALVQGGGRRERAAEQEAAEVQEAPAEGQPALGTRCDVEQ